MNRTQFVRANLASVLLVIGCNRLPEVGDQDSGTGVATSGNPTSGATTRPSASTNTSVSLPSASPDAGPIGATDGSSAPEPGPDDSSGNDDAGAEPGPSASPTSASSSDDAGGSPSTSPTTAPSTSSTGPGTNYTDWPFDATEAQRRQDETAEELDLDVEISIDLGGGEEMEFILIPPGKTVMGSSPDIDGFENDEMLRDATLPKAFYIGKYQTTRAQFFALLGRDTIYGDSPEQPAVTKYEEARDDLKAALQAIASDWTVRFPTEDEYEHAARAGTETIWYNGDLEEDLAQIGWYRGNSENTLQDVGQLLPNAWGLFDMVGNAWHWVWAPGTGSYQDMAPNMSHLVRGGNYQESPFGNGCRIANRQIRTASDQGGGSRFVLELP